MSLSNPSSWQTRQIPSRLRRLLQVNRRQPAQLRTARLHNKKATANANASASTTMDSSLVAAVRNEIWAGTPGREFRCHLISTSSTDSPKDANNQTEELATTPKSKSRVTKTRSSPNPLPRMRLPQKSANQSVRLPS